MILNISSSQFKHIVSDKRFHLPIRWNNSDFADTLEQLLETYYWTIYDIHQKDAELGLECAIDLKKLRRVIKLIVKAVREYLNGFPAKAFQTFKGLMSLLEETPLRTYHKSIHEQFDDTSYQDPLKLYRVACTSENVPYERSRLFHTPYDLRSKVATHRYGIAGFPALYLGTSLELCCEEVNPNPHEQLVLASRFRLERSFERNQVEIEVIELAIKPQDFFVPNEDNAAFTKSSARRIKSGWLKDPGFRQKYLLWYPLIAACSFIRANKKDPFAAEYIIPQLLMQWVRSKITQAKNGYSRLVGIRYFSCASERASDMGFNYVFPTSGKKKRERFCRILTKAFKLTKPHFLHEYESISKCEDALNHDNSLDFIR